MTESYSLTALGARGSKSGCRRAEPPQVLGRKYALPPAPAAPRLRHPQGPRLSLPLRSTLRLPPHVALSTRTCVSLPLLIRTEVTTWGPSQSRPWDLAVSEKQFNARHPRINNQMTKGKSIQNCFVQRTKRLPMQGRGELQTSLSTGKTSCWKCEPRDAGARGRQEPGDSRSPGTAGTAGSLLPILLNVRENVTAAGRGKVLSPLWEGRRGTLHTPLSLLA